MYDKCYKYYRTHNNIRERFLVSEMPKLYIWLRCCKVGCCKERPVNLSGVSFDGFEVGIVI
jgi:hypothetical protein